MKKYANARRVGEEILITETITHIVKCESDLFDFFRQNGYRVKNSYCHDDKNKSWFAS